VAGVGLQGPLGRRAELMTKDLVIRRLATILTVCCLTAVALQTWSILARLKAGPEQDYTVGKILDLPPAAYSKTEFTLVVFGRHNCGACAASLPSVTKLAANLGGHGFRVMYASARPDNPDEVSFAKQAGIGGDDIVEIPRTVRKLTVPSLVLANRQGRVLWTRAGTLEGADVSDIGDTILKTTRETLPR
jgi:hypothetical protein